MHCYSLAVLAMLLMVVASSPLTLHVAQKSLTTSASAPVPRYPAKRQIRFGQQSTMVAEKSLDGVHLTKSMDIEVVTKLTVPDPTICPGNPPFSQKIVDFKNEEGQLCPQDFESSGEASFLGPTAPILSGPWPLPTEHQVTTPTPTLVSGCTTFVMGDLRNPCVRSPKWTSTVTEYAAVDCHGCTSVHVLEPKWHCPAEITTVGPSTASGPSTLTSTICSSTLAF